MLENRTRPRLMGGTLIILVAIFTIVNLVNAQSPTAEGAAATPTPQATPTAPEIIHGTIGFSNCLKCHTDGFKEAPIMPGDHLDYVNEDCEECHEPKVSQIEPWEDLLPGTMPVPIEHPAAEGLNSCYDCHLELGDEHTEISEMWQVSVHGNAEIGCADCHGGDPRTDEMSLAMQVELGYIGIPPRSIIPQVCGGCHSDVERMGEYNLSTDQYAKYAQSVHGTKLEEGDIRVAICTDCHSTHDIKKGSDSTSAIYPLNVPAMCGGCHSDPDLMESYDIPTNQYEQYEASVHGKLLLGEQLVSAPTCASCHGSHGAKPPDSEEVINVCGKCHTATEELYRESLHARIGDSAPQCWTCHGTHDIFKTDESMFINHKPQDDQHCGTCHLDNESFRMDKNRFELKEDRRCATCHHEGSRIMRQVLGIHGALSDANELYETAEGAIKQAEMMGMIVTDAEMKLAQARTSLVSARAAVHTTKLPIVTDLTDEAIISAQSAYEIAAQKLSENLFRRSSMIVAVAIILFIIVTLSIFKYGLDRQLKLSVEAQAMPVSKEVVAEEETPELDTDISE